MNFGSRLLLMTYVILLSVIFIVLTVSSCQAALIELRYGRDTAFMSPVINYLLED